MRLDDIGLRVEVEFPDPFEKHGPREDAAPVAHQVLQKPELARLQFNVAAAARHPAADQVHLEIADLEDDLLAVNGGATVEGVERARSSEKAKGFRR